MTTEVQELKRRLDEAIGEAKRDLEADVTKAVQRFHDNVGLPVRHIDIRIVSTDKLDEVPGTSWEVVSVDAEVGGA